MSSPSDCAMVHITVHEKEDLTWSAELEMNIDPPEKYVQTTRKTTVKK